MGQFGLVYNILSFSLASMMSTTLFLWMRVPAVKNQYQSALIISGMVTFIAAYHYLRIFNSWVEAYVYKPNTTGEVEDPVLTGVPFNDAYRYMDWLLTVPLLLIEIVFVMKLPDDQIRNKSIALGVSSGLMICIGYPGELVVEGNLGVRWFFWAAALVPFLYIFPMIGFGGSHAVVAIQVGYCISDIISKCGVGLVIYGVTAAKSEGSKEGALLPQ